MTPRIRYQIRALVCLCQIFLPPFSATNAQPANHHHQLWTAAWNHAGTQFAIGGVDGLWVFDAATLERKSLLPEAAQPKSSDPDSSYMAVTSVAWHPSDKFLAASSQGPGGDAKGIYDLVSGRRVKLEGDFSRGVSWSPEGNALAMTSDGHLRIWDATGALLQDVARYKEGKGLTGVAWSPSGDRIVTIGARITLHDARGKPIRQMMHRPEASVRLQLLLCAAWHPSADFFAIGDYGTDLDDPVLQFWSAGGDLLKNIPLQGDAEIRNLSWNRLGSRLASASRMLRIWTREGEPEFEAASPEPLWGVDWHPNDGRILTCSGGGRITLWSSNAQVIKEIVLPR